MYAGQKTSVSAFSVLCNIPICAVTSDVGSLMGRVTDLLIK